MRSASVQLWSYNIERKLRFGNCFVIVYLSICFGYFLLFRTFFAVSVAWRYFCLYWSRSLILSHQSLHILTAVNNWKCLIWSSQKCKQEIALKGRSKLPMIVQFLCPISGLVSFSCDCEGDKSYFSIADTFLCAWCVRFWTPNQEILTELSEGPLLCCGARYFTLTLPFSAKVYNSVIMAYWWDQSNKMGVGVLRWTSIPSREE